jgi:spore germination protein KA
MPINFPFGKNKAAEQREQPVTLQEPGGDRPLSANLDENERMIRETFRNCSDLVVRRIVLQGGTSMLITFLDGMVEAKVLDENLLNPLLYEQLPPDARQIGRMIQNKAVAITALKTIGTYGELVFGILSANAILLVDGMAEGLLADVKGFQIRSVEEPMTEAAVRGPRDGFTESLRINTTLLRRRIRSSRLKFESVTLGELTRTDCLIAYIEGLAPDSLVTEVRNRLSRIRIDSILESQYIEELIEDNPYTPFPQIQDTERPDIVAGSLLEGKVAILVDNTPFVLIMPFTFWSGLQAREDYYNRFLYSDFIRFVRIVFLLLSLLLPSLYVALTTFHPKLLPTGLLISIAAARENVPFPALIEALMMELVFEALREAGIRMPRAVGSAVNIVGALVIGQSAVQAGIVSAPMVIVVAATGIANFLIPRHALGSSVRLIRFALLILSGFLGLYGVAIGVIALTIHLVNLQSFGVPYLSPFAPVAPGRRSTDMILRMPRRLVNRRNG